MLAGRDTRRLGLLLAPVEKASEACAEREKVLEVGLVQIHIVIRYRSTITLDTRRDFSPPLATIAATQGSELMAMRMVSKTMNPGSNPGSPAA